MVGAALDMAVQRLILLAVCAVLTTGIQPFSDSGETPTAPSSAEAPLRVVATREGRPSEAPGPQGAQRHATEAAILADHAARLSTDDRRLAMEIFERLSHRHTGLANAERLRVAHTIVAEARAQDLEPDLVIAVIQVESAGYALAVSHVGAMGLMQLLPSTGEELAHKLGIDWKGDDTLFDPIVNIKLGTAYLRELADRYGDVSVALAAYNWGPGRIDRRIRRGATIPSKYIEQVTRAYERQSAFVSRSS